MWIRDIFYSFELPRKINIWSGFIIASPYLGPFMASFVVWGLDWRWAYWIYAILNYIGLVLILFFADETFYDFASVGVLYFLFDRDNPARHPTVPAYESEELQREMIDALKNNPRVRAALIAFPTAYPDVDGVHNRDRAPLIWQYLEENFQPAFDENGVVFWMRR